ncbi:hypothetical protein BT96DRAFT_995955 [Gymnopus androsaceus JB14]|uniref:Uncharacterized protein n=1 Tax=Gymnopus androsaceus JB14 TaxID=1447944 RepID=A0A6A4HH86_9AGAR|nr:hypothetical protein BT96DRAFT_995955 [Gymnopus androsaceus JB14]
MVRRTPISPTKIRHIRDPKKRMAVVWAVVWAHCKTKMVCEPDDPEEREVPSVSPKSPSRDMEAVATSNLLLERKGLKLFLQYKKPQDDDEVSYRSLSDLYTQSTRFIRKLHPCQPDKRLMTPQEVYTAFKKMTEFRFTSNRTF